MLACWCVCNVRNLSSIKHATSTVAVSLAELMFSCFSEERDNPFVSSGSGTPPPPRTGDTTGGGVGGGWGGGGARGGGPLVFRPQFPGKEPRGLVW